MVSELRHAMRFAASVLLRKVKKVDLSLFITDKLMKSVMKHIEFVSKACQKARNVEMLQQHTLDCYGAQLHISLHSRRNELRYLRSVVEHLLPTLLPPAAANCNSISWLSREVLTGSLLLPSMDRLADPDFVNFLVLLYLDGSPTKVYEVSSSPSVPFLEAFVKPRGNSLSVLRLDMKSIRKTQELLFLFMKFLQGQGAVCLLQFCLAVEEFNDKLIKPDISEDEKRHLHAEVCSIYRAYCTPGSLDRIGFQRSIVEGIKQITTGPYQSVVRLQTSPFLFQAYDHVLTLLEDVFTPMFWHSDEYFRFLVGEENASAQSRGNRGGSAEDVGKQSGRAGRDAFAISRLSTRIKHVFKGSTMEGGLPNIDDDDLVEQADVAVEEGELEEEDNRDSPMGLCVEPLDLSTWHLCLPSLDLSIDETRKDKLFVFLIEVERPDVKADDPAPVQWTVRRKYDEFYVLQSKLTEFHGSFPDTQLPPKKVLGAKGFEFLESKRKCFEQYLQSLLQHPELMSSQLLVDFLSRDREKQFYDRSFRDVNIGKIFKAVPRLMKERGSHLEPFIHSFVTSCEAARPRPGKNEITVLSPGQKCDSKLLNLLYGDNASRAKRQDDHRTYSGEGQHSADGIYDYLLFIGRLVFSAPAWLLHFLFSIRIPLKHTLEAWASRHLSHRLSVLCQSQLLANLIRHLQDAIFETDISRTQEHRHIRAQQTFQEMLKYIPDLLLRQLGEEARYDGVKLLFDAIQQPLLNKQLSYMLLDLVLLQLFPELGDSAASAKSSVLC
uniref:Sorting nexin 14 n=1 Tax=Eptatretus burgeri TaxID=7764 RepID=A0A8C4QXL4_EPTBU